MKSDLARFGRGFVYAWNGICAAVREERNFRFHLCAAVYVFAAAWLAELDRQSVALLALCVFSSASFFPHLHTALCSVTLPLYLGWLSGPSFSSPSTHAKETEPCPPET